MSGGSGGGFVGKYDAAGNLSCQASCGLEPTPQEIDLSYDNERRLTKWYHGGASTTVTFAYDGEGNRVAQQTNVAGTVSTTRYIAGGLEEVTTSGSPATTTLTKYESVPGVCSVVIVGSGPSEAISYVFTDGLGSVSEALDGNGNVTAQQLFGPYGGVRYSSGTMPTAKGYTGQYADAVTGLDYYHARYYDPAIGQFTSADTNDKGGLNRYAYVADDPETATDPTGKRCMADGGVCPTGGGSGGGSTGGCTSDATCGCYTSCGPTSGNGTGGGNGSSSSKQIENNPTLKLLEQALLFDGYADGFIGLQIAFQRGDLAQLAEMFGRLLQSALGHNHWAKDPARVARATNGIDAATQGIDLLGILSKVLIGVGWVTDAAEYAIEYYQSSNRSDLTGAGRVAASIIAGVVHATLMTASAIALPAVVDAFTDGLSFAADGVLSFFGGVAGSFAASLLTPGIVDILMPPPQSVTATQYDGPTGIYSGL